MKTVYVITWRYSDGSASGVVSVHQTQKSAEAMLGILLEHADSKQFKIQAAPMEAA